jgi:nicotinate phosphoribosyltransferase
VTAGLIATKEEIRRGETTDIYFRRTMEVLRALGKDRTHVTAEVFVKRYPRGYPFGILAGTEDVLSLLEGRKVSVRAMAEGSLFHEGEPVLSIEGEYGEFCELETAILGYLCQATGVATKTVRLRHAAGNRTLLSFGARRMHPALSAYIDRNAWIGGADGVSAVLSADRLGMAPSGTVPHALVLVLGDTLEAMEAFDRVVDPSVPRVCLVDTLQDEKFEAIRVAEAMGDRLYAFRLDTPASRKGDMRQLLSEVRWELDLRGHRHVKLLVSGGLDEEEVARLADLADGFGVGSAISAAPPVDFSLDLVEVDGAPLAKRGKASGAKQVVRCPVCGHRGVAPRGGDSYCACGAETEPLLAEAMREGKILVHPVEPSHIRGFVLAQAGRYYGDHEEERRP